MMTVGPAAWLRAIPAALWAALIWTLSSMPDVPGSSWVTIPFADKIAHFGLFFIQSLLLRWAGVPAWLAFSMATAWGGIDELHQRSVPGRDPDVWDFMADTIGAAAGSLRPSIRILNTQLSKARFSRPQR